MRLVEKKKNLYLLSIFMSTLYQIFQMCPLFQGTVIDVDNGRQWFYWLLYQHHLLWKVLLFFLFYPSRNPPSLIWAFILVLELETLFGTYFFFLSLVSRPAPQTSFSTTPSVPSLCVAQDRDPRCAGSGEGLRARWHIWLICSSITKLWWYQGENICRN